MIPDIFLVYKLFIRIIINNISHNKFALGNNFVYGCNNSLCVVNIANFACELH